MGKFLCHIAEVPKTYRFPPPRAHTFQGNLSYLGNHFKTSMLSDLKSLNCRILPSSVVGIHDCLPTRPRTLSLRGTICQRNLLSSHAHGSIPSDPLGPIGLMILISQGLDRHGEGPMHPQAPDTKLPRLSALAVNRMGNAQQAAYQALSGEEWS
jgi:hypothetical protein